MPATLLDFCEERLLLDPAGALFWPARRVLIVADLHFEKASAAAVRGSLLPPYDTRATLEKLAHVIARHQPTTIIFLGDSFHDAGGTSRLAPADRSALLAMAQNIHFIWIAGNHDAALTGLPGEVLAEWQTGNLRFRHQAEHYGQRGEISGHFHPKARIETKARQISRPCFVADEQRLILPAFGAYTGGLDVRDPAIAGLFPQGLRLFLLGQARLFNFFLPPAA